MPLQYQPPRNPLLDVLGMAQPTAESAASDAMGLVSPVGMMAAKNPLNKLLGGILQRKRAAHAQKLMDELTPESLPGFPRPPARPAVPPNFTAPEVDQLNSVFDRSVQQVTPAQREEMMRRFVYPNR